ncbi:amidohydrolase family protein [Streptomyces sp. NPDC002838]|uniref:amidohydrolase family protein n=1 Tax=Streptomyces sp. NPDC002838 TaxID=3154436 RepID=UPI00331FAFD2
MIHSALQALRAGHVFDGADIKGKPGMVLVEDGVIRDVDVTGAPPPQHATVTDFGPDGWLLPGLVDAHVHLCWDAGTDAVAHVASGDRDTVLKTARASAATALQAGITTVRDLGDRDYLTLELRDLVPPTERPEIVAAGPPITTPGGHCHFLGGETEGADALRAAVRERAERGCDVVKVMASGGNVTPGSSPLQQQYGRSDLRLVVAEAHRLGLAAAAHVHAAEAIGDVIAAGFDTIEHFTFFTAEGIALRPELLDEVVRRGIVVSLTLGSVPGSPPPPAVAARIEAMGDLAGKVIASGARVVAGTDAGTDAIKPHDVLPYALSELSRLGMPTLDVLRSATAVAAEAVGLGGRKGVLRPGADADLLVLGSSPVDDISSVTDVRAVYRAGHRVR